MWIDVLIKENSNEISHLYEFIIKLRRMSGQPCKSIIVDWNVSMHFNLSKTLKKSICYQNIDWNITDQTHFLLF